MNRTAFSIVAAALCTAATMMAPVAHAATTETGTQVRVNWSGLDLSTKAGQRELSHRIDVAARQACPGGISTGTRLLDASVTNCRNSVRAQVVRRAGAGTQVAMGN